MADPLGIVTYRRREAGLSVILVLQATIIFVVAPLSATGWLAPQIGETFRFGLAAAAVLTIIRSRLIILLVVGSFALSFAVGFLARSGAALDIVELTRIGLVAIFDVAVAASVARTVFGPGDVTFHRIMGGVILYLSVGLIFANVYRAASILLHPALSGLAPDHRGAMSDLLYFSFGTLTTVGAPGIAPIHPFVRSLSNLEAVIGQLYPPTLLGRLVTLHVARGLDARAAEREGGDTAEGEGN
jgi:hypothetical protein